MSAALAALGPLAGRLLLSLMFFYSGYTKFAFTGRAASSITGQGLPFATLGAYGAGVFELLAAALMALGLKTRAASLAAFAYLVLVTWLFHWHPALRGDRVQVLHLFKNGAMAGGLLLLASFGPGPASVDKR